MHLGRDQVGDAEIGVVALTMVTDEHVAVGERVDEAQRGAGGLGGRRRERLGGATSGRGEAYQRTLGGTAEECLAVRAPTCTTHARLAGGNGDGLGREARGRAAHERDHAQRAVLVERERAPRICW